MKGIVHTRHPDYRRNVFDWKRWRLAYDGGRIFVNNYLKKFSKREAIDEFSARREITYCPRFAGSAVDDVKNSIYQRMSDIKRAGGDTTYQNAIAGLGGGVDLDGSNMNRFIGQMVLPDLLITGKVGIYIDMPELYGETIVENRGIRPYLYFYCAEEIPSWSGDYGVDGYKYTSLLLQDNTDRIDPKTGLVEGTEVGYRHYILTDNGVQVSFYDAQNKQTKETVLLEKLTRIPFVLIETTKSLMEDIADYQIALLNLESADISYILRSNYPLYVEQQDQRGMNQFAKKDVENSDDPSTKRDEITVGASSGRRYPMGAHQPAFIHPSSEPVKASMDKESQIKDDIRRLLNLSLSNLEPKFASADSKSKDDRSLESGLSAIGLMLEHAERQVAEIWSEYTNTTAATIHYPRSYSLKSETERRDEATSDSKLLPLVPSLTYQKKIATKIAYTLLGHIVDADEWNKIEHEIMNAKYISSDATAISLDLQNGLVSDATASLARGYDAGEVEQAKKDHAERIARIQAAQTPLNNPGARGIQDLNPDKGNTQPDNTNRGTSGATSK